MADRAEIWASKRPIMNSLPQYGYQDNLVTDWLTAWVDSELSKTAEGLQNFYTNLQPDTAPSEYLDFLGWLVGFSDRYWDVSWSDSVKRGMIQNGYWIVNHIGTLDSIRRVLDVHQIPYDIWLDGNLNLPFKLSGTFGTPSLRYFIRVTLGVGRSSKAWKEVERTIRNFSAAPVRGRVSYQGFKLGYSKLGDPMFRV